MTTGERIKNLRESNNLTQEELASLTNTSKQTIYKYENNIIINIPYSKIEMISEVLQVSPAYLLGWDGDDDSISVSNENLCKVSIAERLNEALSIRGMKQIDLIKKTGLSKSSINNYLYGKFKPKYENIRKMAKVLDVNEDWLYGYDVQMDCLDLKEISSKQESEIMNVISNTDIKESINNINSNSVNTFKLLGKELSLYASISGRLYEALYINDMKPTDLTKKTRIQELLIHNILCGRVIPSTNDVRKIARVLNISEDWLAGYNVPMNPSNSEKLEEQRANEVLNIISDSGEMLEDKIIRNYSEDESRLLENYNKLNDLGKSEASKRIEELTLLNKYCDLES
ncbi:helix-turn-helix transcriptional regulator [Sedimentibacter sp. B4]|uniref:helix-turn-helix domain-containing protein n=1 Tax=Sedimentibacter sp. B4 TaxID=304766 RepID=UPI0002FFE29D|nr:helix-turn-helix transcriptional regulator [Sedimentibacter sp. B4]